MHARALATFTFSGATRARAFVIRKSGDIGNPYAKRRRVRWLRGEGRRKKAINVSYVFAKRERSRVRQRYSRFIFYFDKEMFYIFSNKFKLHRVENRNREVTKRRAEK